MTNNAPETPILTIDNVEYPLDSLSEHARAQLGSLQFVETEIARLSAKLAVFQTARIAYQNALRDALPRETH